MSCYKYKPCNIDWTFIDDGSMEMYEKLCYVVTLLKEALAEFEGLDELLETFVTKIELTDQRLLDESGNFTGTWFGMMYDDLIDKIENGDFKGTWNGESKSSMDNRITYGDFLGTWFGETKSELDTKINSGLFLYQEVIDLINSNPQLNIEIYDGGWISFPDPPTQKDLGLVTDPVTETIDGGAIIYPCQCTPTP